MRVALVGRFPFQPEQVAGGVETSTANLLEGLHRIKNMNLHVVTFTPELAQPISVDRDDVCFHYLPAPTRLNMLTRHVRIRRRLRRFLRELNPDVVHALDCLGSGYVCLKEASDYPVVVSIHGIVTEEGKYVPRLIDKLRTTFAGSIQAYCIRNARYLIQPTRYPEEYFGPRLKGKIVETGNATSDRFFEIDRRPEPGRLLYSGRLIPLKRIPDLIEAIGRVRECLPGVVLRLAGAPADPTYRDALKGLVADAMLDDNVIFLGHLSPDQLVEEYSKCCLVVLASAHENSPMVIVEAMAAGRPVVATRVGGIPYLVDDEQTGFIVDVGDIGALSDRILAVLQDAELQSHMGQRAKERAKRFRSSVVAAKVRNVYTEAIRDPQGERL
jgi:glycosyltransferase involved in cell wall biosynthesis